MKILNAVRILLLVFLVLSLLWGLGVSYWTLSGTSQQAVTTPSQRFPFPWSGAIDFIETPDGDVYVLSEVFNSILRYDQAGRVIARYRFLSEHSPIYTRLAVGHDGTIYVQWDLEQLQNSVTCKGHKYSINGLASSPDGRWLVSVSGESSRGGATSGEVKIWDVRQRQGVAALQLPYPAESIAFSPDG